MKRIAILAAALALISTSVALAGTKPAADCTCLVTQTQSPSGGLRGVELTP